MAYEDVAQQQLFDDSQHVLPAVEMLADRFRKTKGMDLEIHLNTTKLPNLVDGNPLMVELPDKSLARSTFVLVKGRFATFYLPVLAAYSVIGRRVWAVKRFDIPLSDKENYVIGILNAKRLSRVVALDSQGDNPDTTIRLIPHVSTGKARQLLSETRKLPVMSTDEAKHMVLEIEAELVNKQVATRRLCTRTFSAKEFA